VRHRWLRKAAEKGHVAANYLVGTMAEGGSPACGVRKNLKLAFASFARAANHGHVGAQRAFGRCLERGLGVGADPAAAHGWYRKAAAGGDDGAFFLLGRQLETGVWDREGGLVVAPDFCAAREW